MRVAKKYHFSDKQIDGQIKDLCNAFILQHIDISGNVISNRKWIVNGITIVMGTDANGNPMEYPTLSVLEITP